MNTPTQAAQSPAAGRGQQIESQLGDPRAGEQHMTTTIEALKQRAEQRWATAEGRPCESYTVTDQADYGFRSCERCAWAEPEHVIRDLLTALPSSPSLPVEAAPSFEFYQKLRESPQYAEAERESGRMDMSAGVCKKDPAAAARKIERLRALLAWFTLRYQFEHQPPQPSDPTQGSIEGLIAKWRATAAEGSPAVNREPSTQVFNATLLSCADELAALAASAGVRKQPNKEEQE